MAALLSLLAIGVWMLIKKETNRHKKLGALAFYDLQINYCPATLRTRKELSSPRTQSQLMLQFLAIRKTYDCPQVFCCYENYVLNCATDLIKIDSKST